MAQNKNQHFVPRCHLKPFSLGNEGKAINVFNHLKDKIIINASVKGQCAKPYFYGKDLELEKLLAKIESRYAKIVKKISDFSDELSKKEMSALKEFAFLQMNRTEANIKRRALTLSGVDKIAHAGLEEYRKEILDTSHDNMMRGAMLTYARAHNSISDLEVALIENRTKKAFVTSDDPAILTNRLFLQRLGGRPSGMASVGVQFFLPLTPKIYLVCYDKDAYMVGNKKGHKIFLDDVRDVMALNELQFIRSQSNIYFQNQEDSKQIRENFLKSKFRRPKTWFDLWLGIPTHEQNDMRFYRKAKESEIADATERIISYNHVHIRPSRWLSVILYRPHIYGYTNGSGVGYLRKGQINMFEEKPFWKEEIVFTSKAFDPKEIGLPI